MEIKTFDFLFWTKKSYRSIKNTKISSMFHISVQLILSSYGVTTVMRHYRFPADRSNIIKNENIISDDENTLVHLRCYCYTKISLWKFLRLWYEYEKIKMPLKTPKNSFFDTHNKNTVFRSFNIHHKSLIFSWVNNLLLHRKAKYSPPPPPPTHGYNSHHQQICQKKCVFLIFSFIFILILIGRTPKSLAPLSLLVIHISNLNLPSQWCVFFAFRQ